MLNSLFHTGHGRLEDKNNTFTVMRIGFALIILAGHAIQIPHGLPYASGWPQWLDFFVQRSLDGFFILSGYMITASALHGRSIGAFGLSRVLRIFPALIAVTLLLWLVVGPMFTRLPLGEYLGDPAMWTFPVRVLSQADPLAGLPGVFEGAPGGAYMNGPLWTIRYELMAYFGVGALMLAGLYRHSAQILTWSALAVLGGVLFEQFGYVGIGDDTIGSLARFAPAFMIGAAFYVLRDRVSLSPGFVLLAAAAALAAHGTAIGPVLLQLATAWAILWAGFLAVPGRAGVALRGVEDVSYGIYILHWPIGMIVFALAPQIGSFLLFAVMLPLAIVGGWLMRVWVEKPALAAKPELLHRLRLLRARSGLATAD